MLLLARALHPRLAGWGGGLLLLAGAALPAPLQDPQSVGLFELVLPHSRNFVFHGCLPLSNPDLPLGNKTQTTFALRLLESDMTPIPAQVEVVTRNARGNPLVIELLAPFTRPSHLTPGRRAKFEVLYGEFPLAQDLSLETKVEALLARPEEGPRLIGWDAMGNRFEADLLGLTPHPSQGGLLPNRKGYAARGWRTASVMTATKEGSAIAPALPHLFGVHAYWTFLGADRRISLDLRIHNGLDHGTGPGHPSEIPLGIAYFQALELDLPAHWNVTPLVRDPWFGPKRQDAGRVRIPLVRRQEKGICHVMPPQGQFLRRLTLHHDSLPSVACGHPLLDSLAFCRPGPGLWSWFTHKMRAYFPQQANLPSLRKYKARTGNAKGVAAIRRDLEIQRNRLRSALESGMGDGHLVGEALGWAQPWFYAYAGAAGGSDITFVEGHLTAAGAASAGYERLVLLHRMNTARHPRALWDRKANPLGPESWLDDQGRMAIVFRTHARMAPPSQRLPALGGPKPHASVDVVHARGLRPAWDQGEPHQAGGSLGDSDASLWNWMAHDGEHLIRYTKNPKALVWLGNDPLAKDDLILTGALFRLMVHEQPHAPDIWFGGESLGELSQRARENPRQGLPITRAYAWGVDTLVACYAFGTPDERRELKPWLRSFSETLLLAGLPNGVVSRRRYETILEGAFEGCQTFEVLFLQHARRCLIEGVFPNPRSGPGAALRKQCMLITNTLLSPPVWGSVGQGKQRVQGPWGKWALAPLDPESGPPFSVEERWGRGYLPEGGTGGGIEATYSWDALAYCMRLTPGRHDQPTWEGQLSREALLGCALQLGPGAANQHQIETQLLQRLASDSGEPGGNFITFLALLEGSQGR